VPGVHRPSGTPARALPNRSGDLTGPTTVEPPGANLSSRDRLLRLERFGFPVASPRRMRGGHRGAPSRTRPG
jgi:hypothetical protein